MPKKLLTRKAFVKQLHGDVDRFSKWWADHDDVDRFSKWWTDAVKRGAVPAKYTTMNEADWLEQFMMFCDGDGVEVH